MSALASLLLSTLLNGGAAPLDGAAAQNVAVPDPQRLKNAAIVVRAGEVDVGDGTVFKPGVVIVLDGRIVAVGGAPALPLGSRTIDLADCVVTAGLVDAACQLGTHPIRGASEQSSEVIPQLKTADLVDYYSKEFAQLAREGVTTVYLTPDASSVIAGQGVACKTAGPIDERLLQAAPCVKATLGPETSRRGTFNRGPSRFEETSFLMRRPTTRMGSAWVFREAFHEALQFKNTGRASADPAALRALVDVLEGRTKLRFQAREAFDIRSAQRLCDEFGLSFTLEYGNEAADCLDLVTTKKIPVIYGPLWPESSMVVRYSGEDPKVALSTPKILAERGVTFCLTACDGLGENGLARQVGLAVRYGLERARALRAATLDAAAILGVESRVGRLAEGLDADLVAWRGAPCDDTSKAELVLVRGRPVHDPEQRFPKEIQ